MIKAKYILLFIVLLILMGCSERDLIIDREYPDTSVLEKARAIKQRELEEKQKKEEEEKSLVLRLKEKSVAPRILDFTSPDSSVSYTAKPLQYCWKLVPEDCENLQPIHPDDNSTPFYSLNYLMITKKEKIEIFIGESESKGNVRVPFPNRVEVYIYDENKNLHLYETVENPDMFIKLKPPSDPGNYIFLFKVNYDGEATGLAYHYHGITVLSEE